MVEPHLFFFFLMTHTERMVIIMIMTTMNTTPPTATEVAKVTTLTPSGCEVLAVGCKVAAVVCEVVTPSGMDRGVVPLAPVVPSTCFNVNYPPPQPMTLRSGSGVLK